MATEFYRFQQLPPELREWIWDMTLEPREVIITNTAPIPGYQETRLPPVWHVPTAVPATLQVCSEARSRLGPLYTKAFPGTNGYTRVNFALDTIRIANRDLEYLLELPEAALVQRLASPIAGSGPVDYSIIPGAYGHECLYIFKSLQDLTIIHRETFRKDTFQRDYLLLFEEMYYNCSPVPWFTRVSCPDYPDAFVFDRDSYKQYEKQRRKRYYKLRARRRAYRAQKGDGYLSATDIDGKDWEYSHPRGKCKCPKDR